MKSLRLLFLSSVFCLLSVLLIGCATAPMVSAPGLKETVIIDGAQYISAESLCRIYGLDSHWDPFTKKLTLIKGDKELRLLVNSSTALLGNTASAMDKEAKFYRGSVVIPQSFVKKTLTSFFKEEPIKEKVIVTEVSGPIKSVIIDAGHGGKDPGAVGRGGLKEKDAVLDIAKRLETRLKRAGIAVILTRASDKFVSLSSRSLIANTNAKQTDFFISIHANASRSRWVSGVEVFYLSEAIDEDLRASNAAKNHNLNIKEDFSGKDTAAILWDLIYRDDRKSSIELAELTSRILSRSLSQRNRGRKPARFYVLKGTNIPAILVEVGFISNRREEERLKSAFYRDKIAQAIFEGIIQYNHSFSALEVRRQ